MKLENTQINNCKYCNEPIKKKQKRCKECGSWLGIKSYFLYPETWFIAISLLVSILVAIFALKESYDTSLERQKVEEIEIKIQRLAVSVTNISEAIKAVAKKSGISNTFPDIQHLENYQDQIIEQLPPSFQQEVRNVRMEFKNKNWKSLQEK